MDLDKLHRKLIAAARSDVPSDRVPYAFEQRVKAMLASAPAVDAWSVWAQALWRAAAPCVAITLLLGAWTLFGPTHSQSGDLSQDFENTLLAAVDQDTPADSTW